MRVAFDNIEKALVPFRTSRPPTGVELSPSMLVQLGLEHHKARSAGLSRAMSISELIVDCAFTARFKACAVTRRGRERQVRKWRAVVPKDEDAKGWETWCEVVAAYRLWVDLQEYFGEFWCTVSFVHHH